MKIKIAKSELIHFVGIGGIGMSGLALIMKELGFKVQGSDISNNKNIERLKKNKIKVIIGHNKQNIKKTTILVISSAIQKNNIEDFWVWKDIFDSNASKRTEYGISAETIYQSGEDPNISFVVMQIDSIDKLNRYNKYFEDSGLINEAGVLDFESTICHDVT